MQASNLGGGRINNQVDRLQPVTKAECYCCPRHSRRPSPAPASWLRRTRPLPPSTCHIPVQCLHINGRVELRSSSAATLNSFLGADSRQPPKRHLPSARRNNFARPPVINVIEDLSKKLPAFAGPFFVPILSDTNHRPFCTHARLRR